MSVTDLDVTLAVIAGGQGSRMGGPKHSLCIAGTPILVDLMERLHWTGPTMLVLGANDRGHVPGSELFENVVHDAAAGQGPLLGILGALEPCRTDALVAVPVDMPAIEHEHLAWLAQHALSGTGIASLLRRRDTAPPQIEPFPAFFRRSAAAIIRDMLASGRRAVRALADCPQVHLLDAPSHWPDDVWTNLNTPHDLARIDGLPGYTAPELKGGSP